MQSLLRQCVEKEQNIFLTAINHFGHKHQIAHAIQELSELIVELSHHLEGRNNTPNILEEIADVENMLAQMRIIFDQGGNVDTIKENKMQRLKKRMDQ